MKKIVLASAIAMSIGMAGHSFGAVLASDTFDTYTAGNQLNGDNGGTGFAGAWSQNVVPGSYNNNQFAVVQPNPSLYYPNSGTDDGTQLVQSTGFSADITRQLNAPITASTGTVYVGFLIRYAAAGANPAFNGPDYGGISIGTGDSSVFIGMGMGNGTDWGLASGGSTADSGIAADLNPGDGDGDNPITGAPSYRNSTLLVAAINLSTETASLYVDPDLSTSLPATPAATLNGLSLTSFSNMDIESGMGAVWDFDSVTLGTTITRGAPPPFVPEPATLSVLGLSGAALLLRRKARA